MTVWHYVSMISYDNFVTIYSEEGVLWEGYAKDFTFDFPNYVVICINAFKEGHIGLLVQEINQED